MESIKKGKIVEFNIWEFLRNLYLEGRVGRRRRRIYEGYSIGVIREINVKGNFIKFLEVIF